MKKAKLPVHMPCTKKQWDKELYPLLVKHGIKVDGIERWTRGVYVVAVKKYENAIVTHYKKRVIDKIFKESNLIPYNPTLFLEACGVKEKKEKPKAKAVAIDAKMDVWPCTLKQLQAISPLLDKMGVEHSFLFKMAEKHVLIVTDKGDGVVKASFLPEWRMPKRTGTKIHSRFNSKAIIKACGGDGSVVAKKMKEDATTRPSTPQKRYTKGELLKVPDWVVEIMLQRQEEQGNQRNPSIFEDCLTLSLAGGGFTWSNTPEGGAIWDNALRRFNFQQLADFHNAKNTPPTSHKEGVLKFKAVSMDCTQEQFQQLRPHLEKIKRLKIEKIDDFETHPILVNNYEQVDKRITNVVLGREEGFNRTYIGPYNPKAFIEACGGEWVEENPSMKGKWFKYVDFLGSPSFTTNKWYECREDSPFAVCAFIDNHGRANGYEKNDLFFDLSNPMDFNPDAVTPETSQPEPSFKEVPFDWDLYQKYKGEGAYLKLGSIKFEDAHLFNSGTPYPLIAIDNGFCIHTFTKDGRNTQSPVSEKIKLFIPSYTKTIRVWVIVNDHGDAVDVTKNNEIAKSWITHGRNPIEITKEITL